MEGTPLISKDTALPVAQDKKGRVQDLGRGSSSKSLLQSPTTPCSPLPGSEKGDAIASGSGNQTVDSSQQIALRLEAPGLTKTQRRNLKKNLKLKEKLELAKQITCETPSDAGTQGTGVVKQITHETLSGAGNSGTTGAKQTTRAISSGAGRKDKAGEGGTGGTKRLWSGGSTPLSCLYCGCKETKKGSSSWKPWEHGHSCENGCCQGELPG